MCRFTHQRLYIERPRPLQLLITILYNYIKYHIILIFLSHVVLSICYYYQQSKEENFVVNGNRLYYVCCCILCQNTSLLVRVGLCFLLCSLLWLVLETNLVLCLEALHFFGLLLQGKVELFQSIIQLSMFLFCWLSSKVMLC